MLSLPQIEKLLEHCETMHVKYEKKDMAGDEGPPYFKFMKLKGWCEALSLVLGEEYESK